MSSHAVTFMWMDLRIEFDKGKTQGNIIYNLAKEKHEIPEIKGFIHTSPGATIVFMSQFVLSLLICDELPVGSSKNAS